MEIGDKTRASIRSLGLSRWRLWWIAIFGKTILAETVDGFAFRYVNWRGVDYTIAQKEPSDG
jgi:hypothetical protein